MDFKIDFPQRDVPGTRTTAISEVDFQTNFSIGFSSFFGADIIKIVNVNSGGAIGVVRDSYLLKLFQSPQIGSILSWIIETDNTPLSIVGDSGLTILTETVSNFALEIVSIEPLLFRFLSSSISGESTTTNISAGTGYILFAGSETSISSTGTFQWDIQNRKLAIGKTSRANRALEVTDNTNPQLRLSFTGGIYNDYRTSSTGFTITSNSNIASIGIGNLPIVTTSATGGIVSLGYQVGNSTFATDSIAIGYKSSTIQVPECYPIQIGSLSDKTTDRLDATIINIGYESNTQLSLNTTILSGIGYRNIAGVGGLARGLGYNTGGSTGFLVTATSSLGYNACSRIVTNSGITSSGFGAEAGMNANRAGGTSVGYQAGFNYSNPGAVALGFQAGFQTQASGAVAVGYQAGQYHQGTSATALGYQAGQYYQGTGAVAIGWQAGQYSQGTGAVAVGYQAGQNESAPYSVIIGYQAGQYGTPSITGANIAMGYQAGQYSQNARAIAIGTQAGQYSQGVDALAMGTRAGQYNQGQLTLAIGYQAGQYTQGTGAIAIGKNSGQTGQGQYAIGIGTESGQFFQGQNCIAIGYQAGQYSQGEYSICIGYQAGQTNQAPRSIVLNGTQTPLSGSTSDALYIAPISNNNAQTQALCYDTVTQEITYSTAGVKTFIVDHPEYEDSYLIHGCMEGPEAGVYYRGVGLVEKDTCIIELPSYTKHWKNFSVYLTPKLPRPKSGPFELATSNVENGKFTVSGTTGIKFNWVVYASRGDIEVEVKKSKVVVEGDGPYTYVT